MEARPPALVIALVWVGIAVAFAGPIALHLSVAQGVAGEMGLPLDDGWIHVRFAQNLARGLGFSFNPGEPTSTTTSPLWTLLLALGARVSGEAVLTGIAINVVLGLLLLCTIFKLSITLSPSWWLAASAALLTAVTVPLPWWALSGMEPLLYGLLALLGVLLHIRARRSGFADATAATIVFAFAALARPEMLLLFPLSMLDRVLMARIERRPLAAREWTKGLAIQTLIFASLIAPFFVYNVRVTGYLLPTSYYSKLQWLGLPGALVDPRVSLFSALAVGPARELGGVLLVWVRDNWLLAIAFLVGLAWLIGDAVRSDGSRPRSLLIPLILLVQPVAWAVASGYRPPEYQSQRYIANLNMLFIPVAALGGWWTTERVRWLRRPAARAGILAAAAAVSLLGQPQAAQTYAMNVKNTNEMQVAIGRWLRTNAPQDSLVAVNDIGAIGLISDMRVLDLQGLVTPEVLPLRDMRRRLDGTAPAAVFGFLAERRPDYLVIFPEWYPELHLRRDLFTPVFEVTLRDNITNGRPWMVVYRTVWADSDGKSEGEGR